MNLSRLIATTLLCAASATPASADVTFRLKLSGDMLGSTMAGESTEYRKGLKVRTDSTSNGVSLTTIIDLAAGRMITLWHHSKTADVLERKQVAELFSRGNAPEVRPSITPTSQSRQIAGSTCVVHNFSGTYSMRGVVDMVPPTMVTQGRVCFVKNGPGLDDFTAFNQAAGKNGSQFDPSLGVPFAMEMTIHFKGDEPGSGLMEAGTYNTEVISVSTASIPDSMFEIPADYTVTKR